MLGRLFDLQSYSFNPWALPSLTVAALALLLGASALARGQGSQTSRLFCLVPFGTAVWFGGAALMLCSTPATALAWAKLAHLGIPLIAPAIYHFSVVATSSLHRRRNLVWGAWLISAWCCLIFAGTDWFIGGLYHYPWGSYPRYRAASLLYLLGLAGLLVLSLYEQVSARMAPLSMQRIRGRAYAVALAVGSLGLVDLAAAYGIPIHPLGFLPVLVALGLLAGILHRYPLADAVPAFAAPELIAGLSEPLLAYDSEGRIRLTNPAAQTLLQYPEAELLGRSIESLVDTRSGGSDRVRQALQQRSARDLAAVLTSRAGDPIDVSVSLSEVADERGLPGAVMLFRDFRGKRPSPTFGADSAETRRAEGGIRWSESRLREMLDNMQLVSVFLDIGGRVTHCNKYLLDLLGYPESEVVGQEWVERFVPEDQREGLRQRFLGKIGSASIAPHDQTEILTRDGERRLIAWNNTVLRNSEDRVIGTASIGSDLTERKRAEERLHHGAFYDALTGLPNRSLFMDRLARCIARAKRRPEYRFAALFLDIDRFKVVNDGLGHLSGDKLLIEIGQRLDTCLRPGDSVARLGGDEFAVLIDDVTDIELPGRVAERIQAALSVAFEVSGREVFLTASIGIALNKARYQGPEDFMRDADTAMHHAKAQGKARHQVFQTAMHTRAVVLLQIENDLHRAVEREELSVHYQPIVEVKTGEVAGFEALVRWERPGGGMVPAGDLVRIAEETGLIVPMGAWVLKEACRQSRLWQEQMDRDGPPLMVSVNLSARQCAQPDLVEQVARIVRESRLKPGSLKLEITESILMQEPESAAAMLAELRAQQIQICIDDFGTGYSSLSYLLRFPAHTLKIDRSFVSDMSVDSQHSELVKTIIVLAHNLGMDVIAEGVETEDQMARLRALECDYVQGYLFSKPVDAAKAELLLQGALLPRQA